LGTTVLGLMAMAVPADAATSGGNLMFVGLMVALTLVAVLVTVLHPIAWSLEETRLAMIGPAALGILVFLVAVPLGIASNSFTLGPVAVTPIEIALAFIVASGGVWLVLRFAAMSGLGPLAPPAGPDDPVRLADPPARPRMAGSDRARCSACRSSGRPSASPRSRWSSTSCRTCRGSPWATGSPTAGRPATPVRPCST
ncbi:MAG: hypothetical protein ACXWW6_05305, partial [Candidatus Limnocylindrales bacterium]